MERSDINFALFARLPLPFSSKLSSIQEYKMLKKKWFKDTPDFFCGHNWLLLSMMFFVHALRGFPIQSKHFVGICIYLEGVFLHFLYDNNMICPTTMETTVKCKSDSMLRC